MPTVGIERKRAKKKRYHVEMGIYYYGMYAWGKCEKPRVIKGSGNSDITV